MSMSLIATLIILFRHCATGIKKANDTTVCFKKQTFFAVEVNVLVISKQNIYCYFSCMHQNDSTSHFHVSVTCISASYKYQHV